jgi:hypothetical protein
VKRTVPFAVVIVAAFAVGAYVSVYVALRVAERLLP